MTAAFAHYVDILILLSYFVVTVLIGWLSRRVKPSANSFLNATHSLSLPVVTISHLAPNCGALEILELNAAAAQYGVQAFHFYWIGAIPALLFLSLWVMPVYRHSGIRRVPEYFEKRYGRMFGC
jgi:solute:Na+ symporter, SSS family